jgi:hypothetical protein
MSAISDIDDAENLIRAAQKKIPGNAQADLALAEAVTKLRKAVRLIQKGNEGK